MNPDAVAEGIESLRRRRPDLAIEVRWYPSIPSTMDVAAEAAAAGEPGGLVVVAGEQTAGRGRRGRAWSSPPGAGLYCSYLARPARVDGPLTLAAGVAVRQAILDSTGLAADLKWPNDLLVARRKLAGILAEGHDLGGTSRAVVVGVGIDVSDGAYDPALADGATSLERETGRPVDGANLLAAVVERLSETLAELDGGGTDAILDRWAAAAPAATGAAVTWQGPQGPVHGITAGIDRTGALLMRYAGGLERILAGDVTWQT